MINSIFHIIKSKIQITSKKADDGGGSFSFGHIAGFILMILLIVIGLVFIASRAKVFGEISFFGR